MRTKNIIITIAALALGWLAASCAKQNDIDSYKVTTDGRFGTVEEQMEYLNRLLVTIGEEQVELEAYLEKLEESSNALAPIVDSLIDDLDGRMKAVQDTLGNFAKKSDMEATFATIDVVKSLGGDIALIEVKVKADSITLTDSLKNKIAATHAAVTEKFKSYYTKDSLETLLKVQSRRMDTLSKYADSASTEITNLRESITELKKQHKEISEKLDEEIKNLKGTDAEIENGLLGLDDVISKEFASLQSKVTANTEAIAALEARVGKLELRVQSIEVVPDYTDGSVDMKMMETSIRFEVRPRRLIDSLAEKPGLFSFQIIKTTAATKAGIFTDTITVQSVTTSADEDSLLIVTVNGKEMPADLFADTQTYSARLVLSDGNTDRTSAYFPLKGTKNLSKDGTANCYIVSKAGDYMFKATVKGNCKDSVIAPTAVKVLWESFGTADAPEVGDLVNDVSLEDGYVYFTASGKKGNAVIAAYSDAGCTAGNVLWSWHIWLTDQPSEQVYNNDAGTMMDRNLGATSATKGDVTALGLLYQWGRKDPFLGANDILSTTQAASTLSSWPDPVAAQDNSGDSELNLRVSIANPTTYITNENSPRDWYCTNATYKNDNLWKNATGSAKTIYDPCPVGWRVPDGGKKTNKGVWAIAFDMDNSWKTVGNWDNTNKGMDFGTTDKKLVGTGSDRCWYPAAAYRNESCQLFCGNGGYWSCTPNSDLANCLSFSSSNTVNPINFATRVYGYSVRCLKE